MRLFFEFVFASKRFPFDFIEVPTRNIQSKALYPNFLRYNQTILRFSEEEVEVRRQEFFIRTSYAF